MAALASRIALGSLSFMLLDGVWLGLLMTGFYRTHLAPIARMANGGFAPDWSAALAVYLCLGAGIAVFVAPRAGSVVLARAADLPPSPAREAAIPGVLAHDSDSNSSIDAPPLRSL